MRLQLRAGLSWDAEPGQQRFNGPAEVPLVEGVARAGRTGGIDDPLTLRRANAIWAIVHGWSRLAIDGMTHFQPINAKPPASEIVAAFVTGWG